VTTSRLFASNISMVERAIIPVNGAGLAGCEE
jgi:hypothetical protein